MTQLDVTVCVCETVCGCECVSSINTLTKKNILNVLTYCTSPTRPACVCVCVRRIHSLDTMEEILNVQAHDSEILCLEFSQPDTGEEWAGFRSPDPDLEVM